MSERRDRRSGWQDQTRRLRLPQRRVGGDVRTAGMAGKQYALVLLWTPLIFVFESVDTWQLVLNTVTSVIAFWLIALLQNTERRGDRALYRKLDAVAAALAASMESQKDPRLKDPIDELRAAVKLEEQI